jgi:minor extracellular serine protease Vpr
MAEIGPLLHLAQQVFLEFAVHEFERLERPPFPVHMEVVDDRFIIHLVASHQGEAWGSDLGRLGDAGFRVRNSTQRMASGWGYLNEIYNLAELDVNAYIEAAHIVRQELDVSVPEALNDAPSRSPWESCGATGRGVIIGIIDSGVDVTHPNLRCRDGSTRVLRLWDQTLDGANPSFGYGREYLQQELDNDLAAGTPIASIDRTGHGTAAAGIAAGADIFPYGRYCGVAPLADLVVVSLEAKAYSFASTANVVDAVRYVYDVAELLGRRAVVNLSQGSRLGPHDGRDQFDQYFSELLDEDTHRIVVTSAGNLGAADAHAQVKLAGKAYVDLKILVPPFVGPYVAVDIWYAIGDRITIQVIDPGGHGSDEIPDDHRDRADLSDRVDIQGKRNVTGVRANEIFVSLTRPNGDVTAGTWTVRIRTVNCASDQPLDAWLDSADNSPRFTLDVVADATVTMPGTAESVLAVTAYQVSPSVGPLSPVSSRGPNRLGQPLQLLSAPGEPITTCTPSTNSVSRYARRSGTSFAAAHVSGAVALMLEFDRNLDRHKVIDCLLNTARQDADTAAGPSSAWGAGKLDIASAICCVVEEHNNGQ